MARAVGIDLGGTAIKAGCVTADGEVIAEDTTPTGADQGPEAVLERVAGLVESLGPVDGVGLGVAGLVDAAAGVLVESPNLPRLTGLDLCGPLAARLGLDPARVRVDNDANVAAYGEQWLGAAREEASVLFVTLGTGVGGGLILDGELYHGAGFASEFGHVVIAPGGRPCKCGSTGCVEQYASATAARSRALELDLPPEAPGDLPRLAERAREGSPAEAQLLFKVGRDLGRALAMVVTLLDVRCFVLGGGFSNALDCMETGIQAGLVERSFLARRSEVRIAAATLGERAGWIGAARLALFGPDAGRDRQDAENARGPG